MKDRIRSRRVQLDITQQTLAKRLGVSRVSVTKWESGTTKPDGENLHQLAVALQ
ncbi:helix-turn-helix domain-containing protein, partial [Acinetobacter baumannii]|nr:helix-turn-helix domain-containing protein [Acinetobacter baumannii]